MIARRAGGDGGGQRAIAQGIVHDGGAEGGALLARRDDHARRHGDLAGVAAGEVHGEIRAQRGVHRDGERARRVALRRGGGAGEGKARALIIRHGHGGTRGGPAGDGGGELHAL